MGILIIRYFVGLVCPSNIIISLMNPLSAVVKDWFQLSISILIRALSF